MHVIPNFLDVYLTDAAGRCVRVIGWKQEINNGKVTLAPIVWHEILHEGVEFSHKGVYTRDPVKVNISPESPVVFYDAA